MGLCFFYDEKILLFFVILEKNIVFCFGCKKGGVLIIFLV